MRPFVRTGFFALACAFAACPSASAATFYVSPTGNDGAAGTAPRRAWRSIARVDAQDLRPGDTVLFRGRASYRGNLLIDGAKPRRRAPITIGSYGSGQATIYGGGAPALAAHGVGRLKVRDLTFVGSGAAENTASGVSIYNDSGRMLGPVTVRRVTVRGWGNAGLSVGSWGPRSGYGHVAIDRVDAHDNGNGIVVWAQRPNANRDIDIGRSRAWRNRGRPGLPAGSSSGNGIVLGSTNHGRIHNCVASHNGGLDDNPVQGPAGIWTYDSNAVLIDHNESYANHTGSTVDGDGFDLDQNVTNTVLEDNFAHDNDGPGLLWANGPNRAKTPGNVIRHNTSRNDARRLPLASILLWRRAAGLRVEHNTVIATHGAALGFLEPAAGAVPAQIRGNLFITRGHAALVRTIGSTRPAAIFRGNRYRASGPWRIQWMGRSYGSLSKWRAATGQESSHATRR